MHTLSTEIYPSHTEMNHHIETETGTYKAYNLMHGPTMTCTISRNTDMAQSHRQEGKLDLEAMQAHSYSSLQLQGYTHSNATQPLSPIYSQSHTSTLEHPKAHNHQVVHHLPGEAPTLTPVHRSVVESVPTRSNPGTRIPELHTVNPVLVPPSSPFSSLPGLVQE